MKKLLSTITILGLLGVSSLSASDSLSKNDTDFLGLTSKNIVVLDKKEVFETKGKRAFQSFTCSPYVGMAYVLGYNKSTGVWYQRQGNTYYVTGGY